MYKLLIMALTIAALTACAAPVSNDSNEKTAFITSASFNSNLGGKYFIFQEKSNTTMETQWFDFNFMGS